MYLNIIAIFLTVAQLILCVFHPLLVPFFAESLVHFHKYMQQIQWKRADLVRQHMAALCFLRRISNEGATDDDTKQLDFPEIKHNLTDIDLTKYVENIQRKKVTSISKEAYSDDLYLLRFKSGDLYENEVSFEGILNKPQSNKEICMQSNIYNPKNIPNESFSNNSPKKFFKNQIFLFNNLIKETESIPLDKIGQDLPDSLLLAYSEDIYEQLYLHNLTTGSFLLNSNRFEKEWKKKINDEFKKQFPKINITLTKFISIKREMKKVVISECEMDPIILAFAYSYFDELVSAGWANKFNRKICASVAIELAAKLHDIKGDPLKELFEELENTFRLDKSDIVAYEMPCLIALEFYLNISKQKIMLHFDKIIKNLVAQ